MDKYEIEDTDDWLGSPSRLETVKHYASMLEEDIQSLKWELREAQANISGLVQMIEKLSIELEKKRLGMAKFESETTDQLSEIQRLNRTLNQNEVI
ncbi:hypothetical protein [Pseudomonas sp. PP3]|uniref:hypothetical protein n=1 Tax=Pseudomonas sp. PP3 TaxID=2815936 RepID=UPI001BB05BC4|nr:hypothetical protein [Pseudomonas sp. PP3]